GFSFIGMRLLEAGLACHPVNPVIPRRKIADTERGELQYLGRGWGGGDESGARAPGTLGTELQDNQGLPVLPQRAASERKEQGVARLPFVLAEPPRRGKLWQDTRIGPLLPDRARSECARSTAAVVPTRVSCLEQWVL